MIEVEQLLTAEQVATQLQIRARRVYELVKRGELTGIWVGRYLRIAPRDLAAYLEHQRTGKSPAGEVVSLARR